MLVLSVAIVNGWQRRALQSAALVAAGVVVAVTLVPPLAVIGICLGGGRYADASGALLLFLTNVVAIVLAARLVFVLTGFARPWVLRNRPRQLTLTVTPFMLLAGAILVPLMLTSEGLLATESRARVAERAVTERLGDDADLVLTTLTVDSGEVQATVTGAGDALWVETMRTGDHDCYERWVFEFDGDGAAIREALIRQSPRHLYGYQGLR